MYILYKTTNTINGRTYIGVHKQKKGFDYDQFDGYYGSGKALKLAIAKYGIEVFQRETIAFSENKQHIYQKEKELVDPYDPLSYNMKPGGIGGFDYINENKLYLKSDYSARNEKTKKTMLIKYGFDNCGSFPDNIERLIARNKMPKSTESIEKQRQSLIASKKTLGANNGFYGKTWGDKHPKGFKGKFHSEESKQKSSNNPNLRKPKEIVVCPHCGKLGGKPPMYTWHFDKCKFRIREGKFD